MCLAAVNITLPGAWPVLEVLSVLPLLRADLQRVGQFTACSAYDPALMEYHDSAALLASMIRLQRLYGLSQNRAHWPLDVLLPLHKQMTAVPLRGTKMVLHFAILHAGACCGAFSSQQLQQSCHRVHGCKALRVQAAARCGAHMPDVAAVSAHLSALQMDCLALSGVSGLSS